MFSKRLQGLKYLAILGLLFLNAGQLQAQPAYSAKVAALQQKVEDSLKKEFSQKKLQWPPNYMYLRSFKYDRELEVWVKNKKEDAYQLYRTFRVCQQSGKIGPKRMEGDYQVPEGFYYIDEFKPNSAFHLSLGVNYPNASDKILSDPKNPGSRIFVHGDCVSTGCIPITNAPMEFLYVMAANVKAGGVQEFIPLHIFPVRYKSKASMDALAKAMESNPGIKKFNDNIRPVYDFFETKKNLPIILVNQRGDYVIN